MIFQKDFNGIFEVFFIVINEGENVIFSALERH